MTETPARELTDSPDFWDQPGRQWLLLAALVVLAYGQTVTFGFTNWDDMTYLGANPMLDGFTWENLKAIWLPGRLKMENLYLPLMYQGFMVEVTLFGYRPSVIHGTNVLLQALNAGLVLLVARRWLPGRPWAAFLAALLFALHPLQVEAVAWCMGRKDLQATGFGLAALLVWDRWASRGGRGLPWTTWLLFTLACLTKPSVILMPPLLLAVAWTRLGRWHWRSALLLLPTLAPAALVYVLNQKDEPIHAESIRAALPWLPTVLAGALGRLAFLQPIVPYYMRTDGPPSAPALALSLAVCVGFVALIAWLYWRRRPVAATALLVAGWFMAPGLEVTLSDRGYLTADRYVYLATVAGFIGLAALVAPLLTTARRRLAVLVLTALLLTPLTYHFAGFWRDGRSMWTRVLAVYPESVAGHNNLANLLSDAGEDEAAIDHYEQALAAEPDNWQTLSNLGDSLNRVGRHRDAIRHLRRSLELNPAYLEGGFNLALALDADGQSDAAIAVLVRLIHMHPHSHVAIHYLGVILARQGQPAQAALAFQRACELAPHDAGYAQDLARALRDAQAAEP